MCFEAQVDYDAPNIGGSGFGGGENVIGGDATRRMKGRCREGINVLGMVNLNDLDRMAKEGKSGRGWIACKRFLILLVSNRRKNPSLQARRTQYSLRNLLVMTWLSI
jgi:hypothetical protein